MFITPQTTQQPLSFHLFELLCSFESGQCTRHAQVRVLGILLGDKKPGPFKLEVDWINASKMIE